MSSRIPFLPRLGGRTDRTRALVPAQEPRPPGLLGTETAAETPARPLRPVPSRPGLRRGSRHGADVWDAAVREGRTLSFDDAIAYALDEPGALTQSETTQAAVTRQ